MKHIAKRVLFSEYILEMPFRWVSNVWHSIEKGGVRMEKAGTPIEVINPGNGFPVGSPVSPNVMVCDPMDKGGGSGGWCSNFQTDTPCHPFVCPLNF